MKSTGFKTVSFLLWFLLVHLRKQSLGAPGPHVSTLSIQRLDLDEPFKTSSFLLWFLLWHLLKLYKGLQVHIQLFAWRQLTWKLCFFFYGFSYGICSNSAKRLQVHIQLVAWSQLTLKLCHFFYGFPYDICSNSAKGFQVSTFSCLHEVNWL